MTRRTAWLDCRQLVEIEDAGSETNDLLRLIVLPATRDEAVYISRPISLVLTDDFFEFIRILPHADEKEPYRKLGEHPSVLQGHP